jgi:metal-responsive CopG/Arc/MetJ family transcriptional regulator
MVVECEKAGMYVTDMPADKRLERVSTLLTPEEVKELDDWQFANRMRNRSDAIRAMMRLAIDAQKPNDAEGKP